MEAITYEQWLSNNGFIDKGKCLTCGGSGEVECRCCGSTIDCDECDGTGKNDPEQPDYREMYEEQLRRDRETYNRWIS